MSQLPIVKDFDYSVEVTEGKIDFRNYSELLKQATTLADYLSQVKLDEDNLAEGKKLVAKVRKKVDELKRERTRIRQSYMRPVDELTDQINNIGSIVSSAEDKVREQIRRLEEQRREAKKAEIRRIWDLRLRAYSDVPEGAMDFDAFLVPEYLNKTYSILKVEAEMVDFMETTKKDVSFIERVWPAEITPDLAAKIYKEAGRDLSNVDVPKAGGASKHEEKAPEPCKYYIRPYDNEEFDKAVGLLEKAGVRFTVRRAEDFY